MSASPFRLITAAAATLTLVGLAGTAASAQMKAPPAAAPAPAADAGAKVFRQCAACHSIVAGKNVIGPSLNGVVGRKAGTAPNFHYSVAMKNSGLIWNEKTLDVYLTDPRAKVPGNIMAFAGLKKPEDRAAVINYLKTAAK